MTCSLIFCLHNHQPVGNFDHILKWAYDDCYSRIIEILKEYPDFRFAMHHSGPLLEWIKQNAPEYLQTLKEMTGRGQLEIIGGGFYEPIFSIINENDIKNQIALMQDFCKKEFGVHPRGFWTAERVWDPDIPNLVSGFGLDYTILDDIHFRYAGIDEDELYGYFITERLEKKLFVFPIDRHLRYSIPFRMPEETINYLRRITERTANAAFVYGDDGEKFGLWPDTFKWVFEEKWLRNFVEAILKESWIRTTLPSEYIASSEPRGRVYLTQGSYFELSEWALPSKAALNLTGINAEIKSWKRENDFYPFLKGGVWNNFLIKYPESNAINKRTILLSNEISVYEKNTSRCKDERIELYRSECNCAYWHGLFGGIYLNHLRHALYEHILKAESIFLKRQKIKGISVVENDFWNEGNKQILLRSREQSIMIIPYLGGTVSEIGIYDKAFNICNVLPRRYEAYHDLLNKMSDEEADSNNANGEVASIHDRIILKEKNLKRYLIFDKSRRYSFKDLLMENIPSPEDLIFGKAEIYDCGTLKYDYKLEKNRDTVTASLSASLLYRDRNASISKKIIVSGKTGTRVEYVLSDIPGYFGVELNFNLLAAHDKDRYYAIPGVSKDDSYLDIPGTSGGIDSFSLNDDYNRFRIRISTSIKATLVRYPVYTVSQSDSGFEKNYQGSSMILAYKPSKDKNSFTVDLSVE